MADGGLCCATVYCRFVCGNIREPRRDRPRPSPSETDSEGDIDGLSSSEACCGNGVSDERYYPELERVAGVSEISVNTILPTQFYETQLDFFGKHMFDLKSEPAGKPEPGHDHYE